jgi:PAS domain S-box-containing protein
VFLFYIFEFQILKYIKNTESYLIFLHKYYPFINRTQVNKEWLDFTGVDFEDFKNFGYHNVMHPDELVEFQNRFQKAFETRTDLEMEMRFMNLDGEYKWHLNRASPVKNENGDIEMWIGVTTEIQKLKEEEKRKGEFLKMVSHELRTPITSIKGYVGILLRMLKEEHEKYLHPMPLRSSLVRIDVQIIRLTKLISEILDLSRLEEGKLELQHDVFNLNELVSCHS